MSLFCISCQVTRRTFFSLRCPSRNYSVLDKLNSKISRPFFTVKSSVPSNLASPILEAVRISFGESLALVSWVNKRKFCTKARTEKEILREKSEGADNDDITELEENLTDEERQILRELEEEERRFRERLTSQTTVDETDYDVWDGKFESPPPDSKTLASSVSEGHVPFENRQRIIQDVIEEIWNPLPSQIKEEEEPQIFPRGKTGVFDLGELVDLLREENADEVVAIIIPKELDYADYMVIATVGNQRHLLALATFVRKRFKMKDRKPTDVLPLIDKSVNHNGWIALDLGNIILHIFLQEIRDYYDLEMLWTVGPLYDDLTNAPDPEIVRLLNSIK